MTTQVSPGLSGDVPAFSTFVADETNHILAPSGDLPGVGFRQDALRIVILGTDAGTRYEAEDDPNTTTIYGVNEVDYDEFTSPGMSEEGTPYNEGAQIQETVTALNDLGIMVIGVGHTLPGAADPREMLEAYSKATGAINEGDTIVVGTGGDDNIEPGEPLYFAVNSLLSSFAPAVEAAVENQIQCYARDISGNVWNDLDDDGMKDAGESGKYGITVYLDFDGDGELDTEELQVTTDASGDYLFENVIVGTTTVRVDLPTRWGMTPHGAADFQEVHVQAGYRLCNIDFGIQEVTAVDDTYLDDVNGWFTTDEDTALAIAVSSLMDNDFDTVPSTTNTVFFSAVDDSATHGTVTVTATENGIPTQLSYSPPPDFNSVEDGVDTFFYSLTDGQGYVDWATVTVYVTPVNDAPRIVTEFHTRDGLELSGTLASDIENDDMTAVHFFGVEHGTFDMDDDGSFTYTPEAEFVGIETIWVNYVDEHGESSGDIEVVIAVCESAIGTDVQETHLLTVDDLTHSPLADFTSPVFGTTTVTDSDDDLIIVGSPDSNRAFIYRETSEGWTLEAELEGPYASGLDAVRFGSAVAIRGDVAVIGAMYDWDDLDTPSVQHGAVYIYEFNGTTWQEIQTGRLTPTLDTTEATGHDYAYDQFGTAVAINENADTIVVGAPGYNVSLFGTPEGAAYVFEYGTSWQFSTRLDPMDPANPPNKDQESGAEFGNAVAISYDTIVVGADKKDETAGTNAGAAYVYKQATSSPYAWTQDRKLTGDGSQNDYFGCSVAVYDPDGDPDVVNEQVVVGASGYDGATADDIGAAYLFTLTGTSAELQQNATYQLTDLDDGQTGFDSFGWSVDILDGLIAVGAPARDAGGTNSGAAYLIDSTNPGSWETGGLITPSTQIAAEQFGASVAIGKRGLAFTGPGHDGSDDEAALHFFAYNRTPAAKDMELVVAGATGTSHECGSVFGVDAFEGDSVTYSIVAATTGYQQHGTFSFEDPLHPEVVTYTPTSSGVYPVSDKFQYKAIDADGAEDIAEVTVYFGSAQILNRGIFYAGDTDFGDARDVSREGNADMEAGDDNIVTHPDGITGVIIDVAFPSDPAAFSPEDFACAYVNSSGYWETIVPEITVEVVTSLEVEEGDPADTDYDCHRVRLTFSTGIETWLEVTMYDSELGVSSDTFYFGYLWGDASGDGSVGGADLDEVRAYWGSGYTVPVAGDINGDGDVNTTDLDYVRSEWGETVPTPPSRSMTMSSSSSLSSSTSSAWTAAADQVYSDYGLLDNDPTNDLAIDAKFWRKLFKALELKW